MNLLKPLLSSILLLAFFSIAQAQRGPGGVSDDLATIKNCRLWLDAGDLYSIGDNNEVNKWYDKSISAIQDTAVWNTSFEESFTAPLFRSDPAYSINGKPVISFEDGGMLLLGLVPNQLNNEDLVTDFVNKVTYQRSIFIAFRTANDVTTRQYLWEQGGGWKGLGIYIYNSELYVSVYDVRTGDGNSVPSFGFSYKKIAVQPNTTYVVSLILDAPTDNTLDASVVGNTSLRGTLNGTSFGNLMQGSVGPGNTGFGVGGLGNQGDPIGIGGINSVTADESTIYDYSKNAGGTPCQGFTPCSATLSEGLLGGLTGQSLFKGRIAEIAYYAYGLNDAERIIVDNYMAAKYFSNTIVNDKYIYQSNYGNDAIGIGAQAGGQSHNVSQGDNLFEISVDDMGASFGYAPVADRYLMAGHNNNPMLWINQNTPDTANVVRLRRTWRFDKTGTDLNLGSDTVRLKLNSTDLPSIPAGHKLAVLIDDSDGPFPNFSTSPKLIEFPGSGGDYDGVFNIPDGSYFTIAAVKPTIQFKKTSDFALETDVVAPQIKSVAVELNYTPQQVSPIATSVVFVPGSATISSDFDYSSTSILIPGDSKSGSLFFDIVNEDTVDVPPVKDFLIILKQTGTTAGFFIGAKDTLSYKIYDDDPDPKATFISAVNDSTSEYGNGGTGHAQIDVRINGTTDGTFSSMDRTVWIIDKHEGTAIYGADYTLASADGWLDYSPSGRYKPVVVPVGTNMTVSAIFDVFDDEMDEVDESIKFILEPRGAAGIDASSIIEHTINLVDVNPEPEVQFLSSASEGYEAVSQPRIVVGLSAPSSKNVIVPFSITGGTADASDYFAGPTGEVKFLPGDTITYLYYDYAAGVVTLGVTSDGLEEVPDETIEFTLQSPAQNSTLGSSLNHTYTIKDYLPFEWEGVAGVGRSRDNTFWMNLDDATVGVTTSLPQLSSRPISIIQNQSSRSPNVLTGSVNNKKPVNFDGADRYLSVSGSSEGKSPYINTSGFYDSKSLFFVFTPKGNNNYQVIYEEGGQNVGMSIYLRNKKLYFQAWNVTGDPATEWGGDDSYAVSNTLVNNTTYIVSCHYKNDSIPGTPLLEILINGVSQGTYGAGTSIADKRMIVHSAKAGIGGINNDTRFFTGPVAKNWGDSFNGDIYEMIYYNDNGRFMNSARMRIIHNYLAARYNIPLITSEQIFDLAYANNTNGSVTYNRNVAGIGIKSGDDVHGIAMGPAELKVKATGSSLTGTNKFLLWGHNGVALDNTWPFSYWNAALPTGVQERSGRVWRFSSNVASINGLEIEMNYSVSNNSDTITSHFRNRLRLLVSSDPDDWSGATVYTIGATPQPDIAEGGKVVFANVNIPDGSYVSLGNTSPITSTPLPIELLDFTARFEVDHVNLAWITSTERNNDYFDIERAGNDLKWEKILSVSGAGNSTTQLSYYDKDRDPLAGISYYRLKQVDFDGQYTYSDVISVLNTAPQDRDEVFMFPNPSNNGSMYLRIPAVATQYATGVRIFDLQGKIVWQGNFELDNDLMEVKYGNLNSGIYLVEVKSEILYESKKLVVQGN